MRRTRDYWRSKYFLEGITLGEFWQYLKPKGRIRISSIVPDWTGTVDVISPLGECQKWERSRKTVNSEFTDLWLRRSGGWICASLDQKIKLDEGGVLFKPKIMGGWDKDSVIRLEFEKSFEF